MKAQRRRTVEITVILLVTAMALYVGRVAVFGETNEMLRYLIDDIAFLIVQALILWLVIDRVIRRIESESMKQKLNMVIGAFYAEVGSTLMGAIATFDADFHDIRPMLLVKPSWTADDYIQAKETLSGFDFSIELEGGDLPALKTLLIAERPFLLRLLENQNLLEHETFTDLLWAVFHLAEELAVRPDVSSLRGPDGAHIAVDINRAYQLLITEWLDYMRHLQTQYPHLFSLAVRTNPLDPEATVVVTA